MTNKKLLLFLLSLTTSSLFVGGTLGWWVFQDQKETIGKLRQGNREFADIIAHFGRLVDRETLQKVKNDTEFSRIVAHLAEERPQDLRAS